MPRLTAPTPQAESSSAAARRAAQAQAAEERQRRAQEEEDQDAEEEDDEEEEGTVAIVADANGSGRGGGEGGRKKVGQKTLDLRESVGKGVFDKLVHALIKLALYNQYQRKPLLKQEINAKVFRDKSHQKLFPLVYDDAQKKLKNRFGMELVEMGVVSGGGGAGGNNPESQAQTQTQTQPAATQGQGQGQGQGRGKGRPRKGGEGDGGDGAGGGGAGGKKKATVKIIYTLRSTLPPHLLSSLSSPSPIHPPPPDTTHTGHPAVPAASRRRIQQEMNDESLVDCGALIDWERGDGAVGGGVGGRGVGMVVLGMILVQDRGLMENTLYSQCRDKFGLIEDTVLPFVSPHSTNPNLTFKGLIDAMVKQDYLAKVKQVTPGRAGPGGNDAPVEWEYRWGVRAHAEIGEKACVEFMLDIAADDQPSEDEDANPSDQPQPQPQRNNRRGTNGNAGAGARPVRTAAEKSVEKRKKMFGKIVKGVGSGGELGDLTPVG